MSKADDSQPPAGPTVGRLGALPAFWAANQRMSDPHGTLPGMELSDRDKAMLDFAGRWYKYAGKQEQDIRDLFDCSATRYWQTINYLIDQPQALAYAPMTVNRLRRARAERQARRSMRRLVS